jgi:hypothetical protein
MIPVTELRYEVKLVAPESYLPRLLAAVRVHPRALRELYPPRYVNNVYLDSHDLSRLNQNYAGINDRSKLRYRWYGEDPRGVDGHLEFKLKHGNLGWKQTYAVVGAVDLQAMNWTAFLQRVRASLPPNVLAASKHIDQPVLINRYHRRYLATADRAVRVTIDTQQRYWNQWATMRPNLHFATQPPSTLVVEVKAHRSETQGVRRVLEGLPLHVTKNSKYVQGCEYLGSLG